MKKEMAEVVGAFKLDCGINNVYTHASAHTHN